MPIVSPSPIKLLIVAEHASEKFGGEALIPFQYFKYLRRLNIDVHLLVHERTKRELFDAFSNDIDRLHFVSDSVINIWCNKLGTFLPDRLALFTLGAMSHFNTQVRERRMARRLIHEYRFNVVHEPIPVSPKQPSMMFGLGIPVIIGPMNGGMDYPPHYSLAGRFERAIVFILRWTAVLWNKILPGKQHAALLMIANKRTFDALPVNTKPGKVVEFAENGVDLDRFHINPDVTAREAIRIIYIGRLVDWKRVDLLLSACSKLVGKLDFQLDIVGAGPLRASLEEQSDRLGLTAHVQFHGFMPQSAAADVLRNSDIMVLPSMRECGGAVVLEAMASGVPVIAAKWGGPADYITEGTGVLVPPNRPEHFIGELADAIVRLARIPDARFKMGQAGRNRVKELYDWRVKARALLKFYEDVVSGENGTLGTTGQR